MTDRATPVGPETPASLTADLGAHRAAMLRFARRKIRDAELAEDAVQDALLAAHASQSSFKGESALRTWLIGILNHKIQDTFRRESRYVRHDAFEGADGSGAATVETAQDRLLSHGEPIVYAEDPEPLLAVARRRMHERLVEEIEDLPPTLKEVFMLQALEGVETGEVCRRLNISEANCWVRLHRARKRLASRMAEHLN